MSWQRLEGTNFDPEVTEGLRARIADPLWLLARQFQTGEFHGEDAASPALATVRVSEARVTAYGTMGRTRHTLDGAAGVPIEALAEAEDPEHGPERDRLSVELGWMLVRELRARKVSKQLRANCFSLWNPPTIGDDEVVADAATRILASRSLDGLKARNQIDKLGLDAVLDRLDASGSARTKLQTALTRWRDAIRHVVPDRTGEPAWHDEHLGYRFRTAVNIGDGEVHLAARDYDGRDLDWYHHDVIRRPRVKLGATGKPSSERRVVLPTPLRYPGMPASRFWEVEQTPVDLQMLAAGPDDLARSVVGAFAATYGDDWMLIPYVAETGAAVQVDQVEILDDYGQTTTIVATAVEDGPDRVWRFFELGGDTGPNHKQKAKRVAPILYVAPSVVDRSNGPAVETVDFVRDEPANVAWAIEQRVQTAAGRSVERGAFSPVEEQTESDHWRYVALSLPPPHVIPFVPVTDADGNLLLRRGQVAAPDEADGARRARSEVLHARQPMWIQDGTILDAGIRVRRRWQRARDTAGGTHLWIGREVAEGAPTTSHTIGFDRLER